MAVGALMANCFIIGCEDRLEAVVIDPGGDADKILMALAEMKLTAKYIVNTHGHFDHVGGNRKMKEATQADILIHAADAPMLGSLSNAASAFGLSTENSPPPDRMIDEGDTIDFGNLSLKVFHTPGHSPGGVSLYMDGHVFVGDTLFAGSIGRTDLPGGSFEELASSIKNKLFTLPDDVTVYTGHGPQTTISREKQFNPFVGVNQRW
jgi:glyoxylase-like metal-dependent hydrolase (beta-lactamase superfamily II)